VPILVARYHSFNVHHPHVAGVPERTDTTENEENARSKKEPGVAP